jgi:predicted extracellular nuclease
MLDSRFRLAYARGEDSMESALRSDADVGRSAAKSPAGATVDEPLSIAGELTAAALTPIYEIQGAGHRSSFNGSTVTTSGIVTALASNGFYLQAAKGDDNIATSDGIFVFTSKAPDPSIVVGAEIELTGRVTEFLPGGVTTNLTITEIDKVSSFAVLSTGNDLPDATVIGEGGRNPPNQVIDDDSFASFDPTTDGIDFYESLEGMLVQINDAQVVGGTNNFGEIFVVADGGKDAGPRTEAGGLYISPGDFNPERIQIDDTLFSKEPAVNVGDTFDGAITGVVSYDFGNYEVLNTGALPSVIPGGNTPETTTLTGNADQLTVATFNVENLNPNVGEPGGAVDRLDRLAQIIVNNMAAPDVLVLEEMQDNNGATNNGVVAGNQTFEELIAAIELAGGPHYEFIQIDPQDNLDGGQPGANIRVGFLYNPERVEFVPQGTADADDANGVVVDGNDAALTLNPGRVDPTNPAFNQDPVTLSEGARKPLAVEFIFNGQKVFIIANHLKSKTGDTPLFGSTQSRPPPSVRPRRRSSTTSSPPSWPPIRRPTSSSRET